MADEAAGDPRPRSQRRRRGALVRLVRSGARIWRSITRRMYLHVFLAAVLCSGGAMLLDTFVFDDQQAIVKNPAVVADDDAWKTVFALDYWGTPLHSARSHKSYRPLTTLTFRANYLLHGLDPRGYHVTNGVLHVIVCLLFAHMCSSFVFPRRPSHATLAAILFAVHPAHVEAVANIVGRAEILSALFALIALVLFQHIEIWSSSSSSLSSSLSSGEPGGGEPRGGGRGGGEGGGGEGDAAGSKASLPNAVVSVTKQVCTLAAMYLSVAASTLCKETGAAILGVIIVAEGLAVLVSLLHAWDLRCRDFITHNTLSHPSETAQEAEAKEKLEGKVGRSGHSGGGEGKETQEEEEEEEWVVREESQEVARFEDCSPDTTSRKSALLHLQSTSPAPLPSQSQHHSPLWEVVVPALLRSLLHVGFLGALLAARISMNAETTPTFGVVDNPGGFQQDPWIRRMTVAHYAARHAWLLLVPSDLVCDRSFGSIPLVTHLGDVRNLWSATLFVAILFAGVYSLVILYRSALSTRDRSAALGMALLLGPFLPASNLFFPVGFTVAERILYSPSMGFCILASCFILSSLSSLQERTQGKRLAHTQSQGPEQEHKQVAAELPPAVQGLSLETQSDRAGEEQQSEEVRAHGVLDARPERAGEGIIGHEQQEQEQEQRQEQGQGQKQERRVGSKLLGSISSGRWTHARSTVLAVLLGASVVCFVILLGAKSAAQNRVWTDCESLGRSGLTYFPRNPKLHLLTAQGLLWCLDMMVPGNFSVYARRYLSTTRQHACSALGQDGALALLQEAELRVLLAIRLNREQGFPSNKNNLETLHCIGVRAFNLQDYERAARCFQLSLGLDLDNKADSRKFLGRALLSLGKDSEAWTQLRAAFFLDPYDSELCSWLMDLVHSFQTSARFAEALEVLRYLDELRPDIDEATIRIPQVLRLSGKAREAASAAESAIRRYPRDFRPYLTLGHAHAQLGDLASAAAAYRRCLEVNPASEDARANLDAISSQLV